MPIQEWFFSNLDKGLLCEYNHWNQSFLLKVPLLDKKILKLAILKLVTYHDGLRLRFTQKGKGNYSQYYVGQAPQIEVAYLNRCDLSEDALEENFTNWQSDFDILGDNLWRVGYVEGYADGSARVYFSFHHLIVDAVSWRILGDDLQSIYDYLIKESGTNTALEEISVTTILGNKGTSYRQWIAAIKDYKKKQSVEQIAELSCWENIVSGVSDSNNLLKNRSVSSLQSSELVLDKNYTSLLLRSSNTTYQTEISDVLLSALSLSLTSLTGNRKHHVLLESHGRDGLSFYP